MICEKCKTDIPDAAKFCPKCGTKIEITKKPAGSEKQKDVILCPKCGTSYPPTAKFCRKDGTSLQKAPTLEEEIRPPEPEKKESKPEAVIEPKAEELAAEAKIEEKPPEEALKPEKPKDVIICPKCGTPNLLTAKFCKKDGTPLKEEVKPSVTAEREIKPKPKIAVQPKVREEVLPKVEARRPSRVWIWVTVFVLVLLIAGAGSYLYFSGLIGTNPEGVQEKINTELREKGLGNIFADVNKNWVATVIGSVGNQTDKDEALNIVRRHKELKDVIDNIQLKRQPPDIERDINKALRDGGLTEIYAQVDQNLIATLKGSANNQDEREKAINIARANKEIRDVRDDIQIKSIPPPVDHYLIEKNINNALRNAGLSNVYAEVNTDLIATLRGSVNNQAERAKALSIARSRGELRGIRDNIQVKISPPPDGIRVDPPKLEGDINRALRDAGLRGVTAEVNDNLEVTLKGSVGSNYEKDRAFEIAKTFKEARKVRDLIFVVE